MKKLIVAPLVIALTALTGCATTDGYYSSSPSSGYYDSQSSYNRSYGNVISVRDVELRSEHRVGAGAVVGAIVGGVVGNQIGGGSGRALATVGGAVAGGYIGDRVQRNNREGYEWGQEIRVRLDNGQTITIVQPGNNVYNGARVHLSGSGDRTRVNVVSR